VRAAAANRPDVQAFEHALAAADAQIEVIKRERIPNVTVSGSYSRFESNDFGGGDVGVALPLFQTKSADLQEATAQRVRLSAQLEDVRRQAEREVLDAYRAYELARREADLFRSTLLPLAEENARLQEQLRRRDEASDADVWNQKIDLLEIRKDYVETLQSLHLARFDLERAVGGQLPIPPTTFPTPGN
jgi:cobalt-zinc-cadmium efflux system outer membrane protein